METLRMKESENKKIIELEVTQLRVEKDRYHEKEREVEKRLRELEDAKFDLERKQNDEVETFKNDIERKYERDQRELSKRKLELEAEF